MHVAQVQVSDVSVSIERGHLHVGDDTYPLRNVAQIRLRSFVVKPPPPSRWVIAMVVIGGIGASLFGYLVFGDRVRTTGDELTWFLALLGLFALGVFLLIALRRKPQRFTALRVVSSGKPYRALVSDDEVRLTDLKQRMIEAINDLDVTYHQEFRSYDINAENFIGEIHAGGTGFVQQGN